MCGRTGAGEEELLKKLNRAGKLAEDLYDRVKAVNHRYGELLEADRENGQGEGTENDLRKLERCCREFNRRLPYISERNRIILCV